MQRTPLLHARKFLPSDYFPSAGLDLFLCSLARLRPRISAACAIACQHQICPALKAYSCKMYVAAKPRFSLTMKVRSDHT